MDGRGGSTEPTDPAPPLPPQPTGLQLREVVSVIGSGLLHRDPVHCGELKQTRLKKLGSEGRQETCYVQPFSGHLLGEYFTHAQCISTSYLSVWLVAVGKLDVLTDFNFTVLCSSLSILSVLRVC